LTVQSGCAIQSRPLIFVASNALVDLNIDAATTLTVTCTPNTEFDVDINDGLHTGKGKNNRQMSNSSGALLPYEIYLDGARKREWGKGKKGTFVGNSGSGSPVDIPVFGRVRAAVLVPGGAYTDSLIATVSF
jgi:spore coat protein U-like protein